MGTGPAESKLIHHHLAVIADPDYSLPLVPTLGFPLWHDYWRLFTAAGVNPSDQWPDDFAVQQSNTLAVDFDYATPLPGPPGAAATGWMAYVHKRFKSHVTITSPNLPAQGANIDGKAWALYEEDPGGVQVALEVYLYLNTAANTHTWYATTAHLRPNRLIKLDPNKKLLFKAHTTVNIPSAPSGEDYIEVVIQLNPNP